MDNAKDRVHTIGKAPEHSGVEDVRANTGRDMSKVAIFVSILSVILLVVFYFGLNQNVTGLAEQVRQIGVVQEQVAGIQGRVDDMDARMQAMEGLPGKARKMVMSTMLMELAQRAAYLGTQMETEDQTAKLTQAMELLQQVQTDLVK